MFRFLGQIWQRFLGIVGSNLAPTLPQSPTPSEPWRNIKWGDNKEALHFLQNYQPVKDGVTSLRVLLYGPVGSGKSSFINSIVTVMRGQISNLVLASSIEGSTSFTKRFDIHKIPKGRGNEKTYYPIVFYDVMGVEGRSGHGVLADDIKLILEGHVKENYMFNPVSPLSSNSLYYNKDPSLDDRVHVLVCVLSANMIDIDDSYLKKMADIREAASNLGIPQVAILTKVDEACSVTQKNLRDVYKSKHVKKKMQEFSASTGIPMNCTFPVKNYSEEIDVDDNVSALILSALRLMVQFGDDFIEIN